MEKISSIWAS